MQNHEWEESKENYQTLEQGRILQQPKNVEQERLLRETELKNMDSDDPLAEYLSYISWTEQAYPEPHSSILRIIQDALREFRTDLRYKNDPRYLKLWIRVAKSQADPLVVFKFLSLNDIGGVTALYYEEYAGLLVHQKRYDEALAMFRLGIEKKAQPLARLQRNYAEFLKLPQDNQPAQVIANPIKKPAPGLKKRPSASIAYGSKPLKSSNLISTKLSVFRDTSEDPEDLLPAPRSTLDLDLSKPSKENEPAALKFLKLPQASRPMEIKSKKMKEDEQKPSTPREAPSILKTVAIKPGFMATIDQPPPTAGPRLVADTSLCYANNIEHSFEESKAMAMGYSLTNPIALGNPPKAEIFANDPTTPKAAPLKPLMFSQISKSEHMSTASPTINTKNAMQDVFSMFNQPPQAAEAPSSMWYAPEDDETISRQVYHASTTPGKVQVFKDLPTEDVDFDEPVDPNSLFSPVKRQEAKILGEMVHVMTPLTEVSEQSSRFGFTGLSTIRKPFGLDRVFEDTEIEFEDVTMLQHHGDLLGQPEVLSAQDTLLQEDLKLLVAEQELCEDEESESEEESEFVKVDDPCDPTLASTRFQVMRRVIPPPDAKLFLHLSEASDWVSVLKQLVAKQNSFEFPGMGSYEVVRTLGEGGFAKVFAVQQSDQVERSLKVGKPPSAWEYYIMYSLTQRIEDCYIPRPLSCHVYQNQSLLLTECIPNGSLIDAVNRASTSQFGAVGGGVDELLALFWTLRLLQFVNKIHAAGVIHGDIKVGNDC